MSFEMGDIPVDEDDPDIAATPAPAPGKPAKGEKDESVVLQQGGLVEGLKQEEASVRAKAAGQTGKAELKTKVSEGLSLTGMSGAQKWRAATKMIKDQGLMASQEKEHFFDGPGAEEVKTLMDTLLLALRLDPKTVEEGGTGKWDGMIGLAVGFLWTETFDNDGIKEYVGHHDGVRILLELVAAYHFEPEIVQQCCGCLASLCLSAPNRERFRQVGGCKIVTDLFQEHRDHFVRYPQMPYNFCSLIKVIAVNLQCQLLFTKNQTHEMLLKMMESDAASEFVMEEAAAALSNIIADPVNVRPFTGASRGMPRVMALIDQYIPVGHSTVIAKLCKVIWNVTDDEKEHDLCFKVNVIEQMRLLCDKFPDDHNVLMEVYGVLRNLSHVRDLTRKQLRERKQPLLDLIPNLIHALEYSRITGVQVRALGFLMNVSDDDTFKQELLDDHILESVLVAMRNTADYMPMQRLGCSLLCNLTSGATFVDGCERLEGCRGLLHVKKQLQNNPMDFQLMRPAIGLIRNMSCVSPKMREYISEKHELIPVVMSAMKTHFTHPFLCRNACSMLSAVCAEPLYAWEVAKRGGVRICVEVLQAARNMKPRDRKPLLQKVLQLVVNICSTQFGLEKTAQVVNGTEKDGPKQKMFQDLVEDWVDDDGTGPGYDPEIAKMARTVLENAEKFKALKEEVPVEDEERDNYVYVYGGHSDPHHLDSGERMDLRTMKWTNMPPMARRRYRPALVFSSDGRHLYAFGGHNEEEKLASVEVLDTGRVPMEWMEVEEMPTRRSHLSGALQPNSPYIYAVGGNDGSGGATGRLKSVLRFNIETSHWEKWGEMNVVRSSPAIAFDLNGEFLYVAGGSNGAQKHKSAERLRVAVNKWEALDDMSTIRSGCCAAMGGDSRFYVMGGYDGKTRLNTCEYYDPATGAWAAGPTMVKRRSGADACVGPDGSVYVVGGTDGVMQHSSIERLSFENGKPSVWNLISEMGTSRESAACCFSLTKPVEVIVAGAASDDASLAISGKSDMPDNPLHEGSDDEIGDTENPLAKDDDDTFE